MPTFYSDFFRPLVPILGHRDMGRSTRVRMHGFGVELLPARVAMLIWGQSRGVDYRAPEEEAYADNLTHSDPVIAVWGQMLPLSKHTYKTIQYNID